MMVTAKNTVASFSNRDCLSLSLAIQVAPKFEAQAADSRGQEGPCQLHQALGQSTAWCGVHWGPSGDELEEHNPKGVDIRLALHVASGGTLRRDVPDPGTGMGTSMGRRSTVE